MATEKNTVRRKSGSLWFPALRGAALSLLAWICGAAVLALVMSSGSVGEEAAFPVLLGLTAIATFAGAVSAIRRTPWGSLSAALCVTLLFGGILTGIGLLSWQRVDWYGHGGVTLLWALIGGASAGILCRPKTKKRARRIR